MKKSIGLLMIVAAVISLAFVSCDANTAPQADTLGEIYLSNDSQSRGITVSGTNTHEVESLYWYYKAVKNDNGLFNTGVTNGFVPVKTNTEGAVAGLSEENLGLFSYGNWTFTFCGVKEKYSGTIPASTIDSDLIVYSGSQTIEVNKDKNFLNLTLNEGAGLKTEIKFDTDEGVWFEHERVTGRTFSLAVVDKVNGEAQGTIDAGDATIETVNGKNRVSFKGITYTAPSTGIAEGKHVMTFTLTQTVSETDTNIATVATYEISYTVSKGLTYTISGDLTSAEVQGEVSVGSYAKSVPATVASLVLPVTLDSSDSSKTVKAPENQPIEVSTMDLTVKYPHGVKLTTDTNTAGSGNNVTADAKIGFELKADKTGGITVDTASQEQTTYELTLNVATDNRVLVEVSKFIGKNLEIEKVYHKGVEVPRTGSVGLEETIEEHYDYSPTEGILKLYVKNASPIDVVTKKALAVAEIGDEKFTTLSAAIEAAADGDTITILRGANVTLDNGIANEGDKIRNITLIGDGTQTVDVVQEAVYAENGWLNYQRGSSFTFENLTIQAGEGSFDGIVCNELTFKNCTIKGKLTLYGKATFINCIFDNTMANQYSIWTWGGTDVTFDGCTFNTNGKAILLYAEENTTKLTVNNCTFNDRNNGAANKAAIEIGDANYGKHNNFTVVINRSSVESGFAAGLNTGSKLWANKNSMDAAYLTVTIDGNEVPAVTTIVKSLDDLNIALDSGVSYIKLGADIDLTGAGGSEQVNFISDTTIDLNGHTLSGSVWSGSYLSNADGTRLTIIDSSFNSDTNEGGEIYSKFRFGDGGAMMQANAVTSWQHAVTIESGRYVSNNVAIVCQVQNTNAAEGVIINGGYFGGSEDLIEGVSLPGPVGGCVEAVIGTVTINGGTFKAAQYGSVIIAESGSSNVDTVIDIYGGTFEGACMFDFGSDHSSKSIVNVYGGDFTVKNPDGTTKISATLFAYDNYTHAALVNNDMFELNIMGGSFNYDPSDYVDTEKYNVTSNGSTWTVTAK
ncbi:MAG: hypothetical protein ACI4NB_05495 [Candidatus Ornithospirochaeta sp.]